MYVIRVNELRVITRNGSNKSNGFFLGGVQRFIESICRKKMFGNKKLAIASRTKKSSTPVNHFTANTFNSISVMYASPSNKYRILLAIPM